MSTTQATDRRGVRKITVPKPALKKRAGSNAREAKRSDAATHRGQEEHGSAIPGAARTGSPSFGSLQLCIHNVSCEQTTNELFSKDNITLVGIETVSEVSLAEGQKLLKGKARKGSTLVVGKFRKGDVERFRPPKVLAEIPLGPPAGEWPRDFNATVLMAEIDAGKLGPIVASVVDAIDDKVVKEVANAATSLVAGILAGSAVGSMVPIPVVGTLAGAVAGAATSAVSSALKKARADDLFPPKADRFTLNAYPSTAGTVADSRTTLRFEGRGGAYQVVCSWNVV